MLKVLKARLFGAYPIRHGFSTRHGGASQGELTGLNLSYTCGDDPRAVAINRRLYFESLGSDPAAGVFCCQVHGNNIAVVGAGDCGRGADSFESGIAQCDGLLTEEPEVPLSIFTADCVAVLFYDPVHHVAGACHAGWPGSAAAIVDVVVNKMSATWGSSPANLLVAMGPAAGGCCYEVDDRVVERLWDNLPTTYLVATTPGKYLVDLRRYNSLRLERLGVRETNIEQVGGCSICGVDYYSHRRQAGRAGRMLATIELLHSN